MLLFSEVVGDLHRLLAGCWTEATSGQTRSLCERFQAGAGLGQFLEIEFESHAHELEAIRIAHQWFIGGKRHVTRLVI